MQTQTVTPVTATTCSIKPDCRPSAATQHYTHCGNTYSNTERKHIVSIIIMNHSLTHSCNHRLVCSVAHPRALARSLICSFTSSLSRTLTQRFRNRKTFFFFTYTQIFRIRSIHVGVQRQKRMIKHREKVPKHV